MKLPGELDKLNSRQHRFCLNILAGMPPKEAYVKAGYADTPSNVAVTPYQLLASPSVASFIEGKRRLKEQIIIANDVNNTVASPQERKQILSELLRAKLVDFLDEDGQPVLARDTPGARAAREFYHREKAGKWGNSVTKNIKLVDPIEAIRELNKMDGSYAPSKHLVAQRVQFEIVHTERLKTQE